MIDCVRVCKQNNKIEQTKRNAECCWRAVAVAFLPYVLSVDGTQANRWHNNVILESCAIHLSFVRRPTPRFLYYLFFFFSFSVSMSECWETQRGTVRAIAAHICCFCSVADHVCCCLFSFQSQSRERENAFAVSDSHIFVFIARDTTAIEWSHYASAFSLCTDTQMEQTLPHWLRHTDKNHTKLSFFFFSSSPLGCHSKEFKQKYACCVCMDEHGLQEIEEAKTREEPIFTPNIFDSD